ENSKIFEPIDKSQSDEEQKRFYRPFHLLTNFLEQEGYAGVLYRSTVKNNGYNVALFDTSYVECNEKSIRRVRY
ncbi:RES family NAD+ phosphorylase, partial [Pseudomonas aeruginosa]|uniref:RES family NAD+ phosphorylase n=1 Tax=Pseudomonas aeruginosa TaxID=287 RepID=UPI001F4BCA21